MKNFPKSSNLCFYSLKIFYKNTRKYPIFQSLFWTFFEKLPVFCIFIFLLVMAALFFVPIYNFDSFNKFLITILKDFSSFELAFSELSLILKAMFYLVLFGLVFVCTVLTMIPTIKLKLQQKYSDPVIKKRGYNMILSSSKGNCSRSSCCSGNCGWRGCH